MIVNKPKAESFNQGGVPKIACFIDPTTQTPLDISLEKLVAALNTFVHDHVAPVWGTPANLVVAQGFVKDAWAIVFLDDADQDGALAYHDLTPDGLPLAKVFVRTTKNAGASLSVATSHELVEMLVDPAINLWASGPDPLAMYAYESADPVEELSFAVDGVDMSDFVYPSYFEVFREPNSVRFDHLGKVTQPFELLSGGYQIVQKGGVQSQTFGSSYKESRFTREDRTGHRSETRRRGRLDTADVRYLPARIRAVA